MKNKKLKKVLITTNIIALCVVVMLVCILFIGPKLIDMAGVRIYDNKQNKENQQNNEDEIKSREEVSNTSSLKDRIATIIKEDDVVEPQTKQQVIQTEPQGTILEQQGEAMSEQQESTLEQQEYSSEQQEYSSEQQEYSSEQQEYSSEQQETSSELKESFEDEKGSNSDSEYEKYKSEKIEWCFKRNKGNIPSGTYEPFDIVEYNAYYLNRNVSEDDKVIYLAFDCGYEYGYTPFILDTLKEHNASAMFFVTKSFLETSSDLIIRMKNEGHLVGNHTMNHPSLPEKSTADIQKEIKALEDYCYEKTGYKPDKYIRPPMGEYSERVLKILQDMDYTTIFWSIAYNDYNVDNQPGKQYVIDHFKEYHHNGAITLTHTVSQSNTEALDEVLTYLEAEGYRFGSLEELK